MYMQERESAIEEFDCQELHCYQSLKRLNWLACSLGTLDGGNSSATCFSVAESFFLCRWKSAGDRKPEDIIYGQ